MLIRRLALLAVLVGFAQAAPPPKQSDPVEASKSLLAAKHVGTEPAELAQFIRDQTARPDDRDRVRAILPRLADENYDTRQAASRELAALPGRVRPLIAASLEDADPEVARRVEAYLEAVPEVLTFQVLAAALTLIERQPAPEAFAALWEFLPTVAARDGFVERTVTTLGRLQAVSPEIRPELSAGLTSRNTDERLWAGMALVQAGDKFRAFTKPLWGDADGLIRAKVGLACAERGERGAVLALISCLDDAPAGPALVAEDFLCRMVAAGQKVPPPFAADPKSRKICREAWEAWWKTNGAKVDLAKLSGDAMRGLTLVSEMDLNAGFSKGRIYELNSEGKIVWELSLASAVTDLQRLPNGHLMVTEWATQTVKEIDRDFATTGKVYWSFKTGGSPILGLRLPDGDTVVGTEGSAVVVSAKGDQKTKIETESGVKHGVRLRNGHLVFVTTGNVLEFDGEFKEVRRFAHGQQLQGWGSVEALANGHYLIADCVANRVVEVTAEGKEVWRADCPNPRRTQRLPNGDTLIGLVSGQAIIRVGRDGKKIDQTDAKGGIYALIRY